MTYEIEFLTEPLAHKNEKIPSKRRSKKTGELVPSLRTKPAAKIALNSFIMQIPGMYRNLNLRHPNLRFQFFVPNKRHDKDNIISLVLDALVAVKTIQNDSIAQNDGRWIVEQSVASEDWRTIVTLEVP